MSCLADHLSLYRENKDLRTLCDVINPGPTCWLIVNVTDKSSKPVEAMLDEGSQLNLISSVWTKELGLQVDKLPSQIADTVALMGGNLSTYGSTTVDVTITDSPWHIETHRIPFVVTWFTSE
jgi:hypothetical protein